MQFIQTPDWQPAVQAISDRLVKELTDGKRVLWLVPGGSGIGSVVEIMQTIPATLTNLLSITLTDERYGEPGHDDSNWQQLVSAGFQGQQATLLPVLISGASIEQVTDAFDALLSTAIAANDVVIAQLGMGPDGHIAGILPGSPATSASGLAAHYDSDPFQRITSTFAALEQATAAYVLAFGEAKLEALNNLKTDLPLDQQPAQVLKRLPEAYVYNDQVGA